MKSLITFLSVLLASVSFSQTSFYKQFSGNGYDYANGIVQLPDSSYVITGSSSSFDEGPAQMFLLKIDSLGHFQWSKHYGGSESDWGVRVKHIPNDGFLVGGYSNSEGNGAFDFALWKIDESGSQQWFKTYGTAGWERVNDMALTRDGGAILVGETTNTNDGFTDAYLVRVDANGNVIWQQQLEAAKANNATSIKVYNDSTYVIAGYKTHAVSGKSQFWVINIHENGTLIWEQTWGTGADYYLYDLEIYGTTIFVVGSKLLANGDEFDCISKLAAVDGTPSAINAASNRLSKSVGITKFREPGLFSVCVSTAGEHSFGAEDLYYHLFDEIPYWNDGIGTVQYETNQIFGDLISTYGNGMISVGTNEHIGPGGSSIFVIKICAYHTGVEANDDMTAESLVSVHSLEEQHLHVFPNPASTALYVDLSGLENDAYELQLVTTTGQMLQQQYVSQPMLMQLDVSTVQSGIYFLQLVKNNHVLNREKILIQK